MTIDPDRPSRPRGGGRYAITAEGPDTRLITEYPSRAAAVLALERELDACTLPSIISAFLYANLSVTS